MKEQSRRQFFQSIALGLGGVAIAKVLFGSKNVFAAGPAAAPAAAAPALSPIDMSETKRKDADNKQCVAIAKGLGYKDASADPKKTCDTCMFYDQAKKGKPTCQLIPKCLVSPKGTCNSYVKKPA